MKKVFIRVAKICTVVFGFLFIVLSTTNKIMLENATMVNSLFKQTNQIITEKETDGDVDTQYYKSKFNSVKEVIANSEKVEQKVVEEGITLLFNKNNALPINKGKDVSLFSVSCLDPAFGGGGSSATNAKCDSMHDALVDAGLNLNEDLWNWYSTNKDTYIRQKVGGIGVKYSIKDAPWTDIPDEVKNKTVNTAIFLLSRLGTENEDLTVNTGDKTDMTNGSYLMLSPTEKTVLKGLKQLKSEGKVGNIVLILNSPNQVETNFLDDEEYGIDSALWCGSFGTKGPRALANVLVGNANPSGRLSDTYWEEHRFNPVMANFVMKNVNEDGNDAYYYEGLTSEGYSTRDVKYYANGVQGCPYVVYQEGIYNGYRYTETRYEDVVKSRNNVGDFNYKQVVSYPFGYGLSYTTFGYSEFKSVYDDKKDVYHVSVKVENTGSVPGKEVIQIYLNKPYTQYDIDNYIEKAAVELVGFAKTPVLQPNETKTVTIDVDREYFASYDAWGEATYIVDEGDYFLTAAKDSHDAINNILLYQNSIPSNAYHIDPDKMVYFENSSIDGASLVEKVTVDEFDAETYSTTDDPVKSGYKTEATEITNLFDNADLNRYNNAGTNKVTYITRNNWKDTVKFGLDENNNYLENYVKLTWNEGMEHDHFEVDFNDESKLRDDVAYPTMGSQATAWMLIDLMKKEDGTPIEYSSEMWEQLLDQLTFDDMVTLLSAAFRHTEAVASIGKPATIDHNGAVGVVQSFGAGSYNRGLAVTNNDPDKNKVPPAYPCNGIVAATFNVELIKEYGEAWGEDALWAGYSGLFGPGINGHRAPYAGRTFEYYSEDPFLAGNICAPLCEGIEGKGVYVYLKHAILNEQETKRTTLATWANEQTIREVYARGFEIAIEKGGARCVMLGLNKIGPYETALTNLCNGLLRNEFGMTGHVITDYITDGKRLMMPYAHTMGTDLPDRDFDAYNYYDVYRTGHGKIAWGMREACHHVLYTIVHSAAMNGISSNTLVYSVTPQWQSVMSGTVTICGILALAALLILIVLYAFPYASVKGKQIYLWIKSKCINKPETDKVKDNIKFKEIVTDEYRTKKEPWWTHIVRGVIGAVAIVLGVVSLVGMSNAIAKTESVIRMASSTDGYINEVTASEGVKDNYFEAEAAEYTGVSCYGMDATIGSKYAPVSYAFGDFHGGIALTNIYTPTSSQIPNYITFKFNSDKKVKCKMRVGVSSYRNPYGTIQARDFGEYYNVYVNDKELSFAQTLSTTPLKTVISGNNTYPMTFVDLIVRLEEGANNITFTTKNGIDPYSMPVAFDYIDVRTSANLTNYVPDYWDCSNITIQTLPTFTSQGIIVGSTAMTLPSVSDGVKSGVYNTIDNDTERKYTIGQTDLVVYQIQKNPHTLTIYSPYATFEDGTRTMTLKATESLPQGLKYVDPVGMKFIGWVDCDDPTNIFNIEDFTMMDRDMNIAPYFERRTQIGEDGTVPAADEEYMKVKNVAPGDYVINTSNPSSAYGFEAKVVLNKLSKGAILNSDGVAEQADIYNYDRVPAANSKFAIQNRINTTGTNTIIYTVQNQGSETITIDIGRTKSSGDAFNPSNDQKCLTLAPFERATFSLYQSGGHDTLITGVRVRNTTTTAFKLAMIQYIRYGQGGTEEKGDIFVKLKGDAIFKDGDTYKMLSKGSTLPEFVLTGSSEGKEDSMIGWKDQDGNFYDKSFKIPEVDALIITPVFSTPIVREGYGKLSFGSGNTGTGYTDEGKYIQSYKTVMYKDGSTLIDGEYASTFSFQAPSSQGTDPTGKDSDFRVLTGYTPNKDMKTKYQYTFKNMGTLPLEFDIFHRSGSGDTSAVEATHVTLAAGETKKADVLMNYINNNNTISHFKFTNSPIGGKLAICMFAYGEGDIVQIDLANATFATGLSKAYVQAGDKLPALASDYAAALGVKDENNVCKTLAEYRVPSDVTTTTLTVLNDVSVKVGTGYQNMTQMVGNEYGTSLEGYKVKCTYYSGDYGSHYTYIGENYSTMFKFDGAGSGTDNTGTNASFRMRTMYDSQKSPVDLTLTVKNLGTETLEFDLYLRGSGSDTSTPDYHRITLAPGAVVSETLSSGGVSSNSLIYFRFTTECNYLNQMMAYNVYAQIK